MTCHAFVDATAPVRRVLRHMRRDAALPAFGDEVRRVIPCPPRA
jgi:hypothetical protein